MMGTEGDRPAATDLPGGGTFGDLSGKNILITGASSGIGRSVALGAMRQGARVVLVGRDQERLKDVASEGSASAEVVVVDCDLEDDNANERLVEVTTSAFGAIHGIVHSAGIWRTGSFAASPMSDFDAQWRLNVRQPYLLTRAALAHLAHGASLVFMSSAAGRVGVPDMAAYCACKGAVEQLTRALAAELGSSGVRVNGVAPGTIDTPMTALALADDGYRRGAINAAPLHRVGTAGEVAAAVLFLLADASLFIHGETIAVDGGLTAV